MKNAKTTIVAFCNCYLVEEKNIFAKVLHSLVYAFLNNLLLIPKILFNLLYISTPFIRNISSKEIILC